MEKMFNQLLKQMKELIEQLQYQSIQLQQQGTQLQQQNTQLQQQNERLAELQEIIAAKDAQIAALTARIEELTHKKNSGNSSTPAYHRGQAVRTGSGRTGSVPADNRLHERGPCSEVAQEPANPRQQRRDSGYAGQSSEAGKGTC